VSDGADVRDLIPRDERIHHIHLESACNIGEKRNYACSRASGEIIAHFDDDDWSHPDRLMDQYCRLRDSAKAVTGYYSMEFTGYGERWLFTGNRQWALGTSLFYRRDWWERHPFLAVQIGEDKEFAKHAAECGELVSVEAGGLMRATNHDGNTSPRLMGQPGWSRIDSHIATPA